MLNRVHVNHKKPAWVPRPIYDVLMLRWKTNEYHAKPQNAKNNWNEE